MYLIWQNLLFPKNAKYNTQQKQYNYSIPNKWYLINSGLTDHYRASRKQDICDVNHLICGKQV